MNRQREKAGAAARGPWYFIRMTSPVYLDHAATTPVRDEVMAEGSIDQAVIHVREVIRRSIDLGAAAIILVHNHPSGDSSPSRQDISMTREIIETGKRLGISVHDHVIIGDKELPRCVTILLLHLGHLEHGVAKILQMVRKPWVYLSPRILGERRIQPYRFLVQFLPGVLLSQERGGSTRNTQGSSVRGVFAEVLPPGYGALRAPERP